MLCTTVVHNDTHTNVRSIFVLGLSFIFLCVFSLGLTFGLFFRVSLHHFVFCVVSLFVLNLVSSVPDQETG